MSKWNHMSRLILVPSRKPRSLFYTPMLTSPAVFEVWILIRVFNYSCYFVYANLHRLAWAFVVRHCEKNRKFTCWFIVFPFSTGLSRQIFIIVYSDEVLPEPRRIHKVYESCHDNANKMSVRKAKTQTSLSVNVLICAECKMTILMEIVYVQNFNIKIVYM